MTGTNGEFGDLLRDAHRAVNELDRLRAVIQAEIDQHFKVQDKDGVENAGLPYCFADDLIWPCPIRRRLESALSGSEGVES